MAFFNKLLGWQPTVLTIEREAGTLEEPEQFEKIPSHIQIERTRFLRIGGRKGPAAKADPDVGWVSARLEDVEQPPFGRARRFLGKLVRALLCFPDCSVGWIPFGFFRGVRLLRRERFDVIYTTEPPRAGSVIGLLLKMMFRTPWVLEFMDPWYIRKDAFRRRLEHWLQAIMLRRADAVVVMIEGHAEDLRKRFHVPSEKLTVVSNGFDEEDFREDHSSGAEICRPGYLHLSHFGTIYPGNSGCFFPALSALLSERPELKERLRVHIVGFPDEIVRRHAQQDGLREVVELRKFIPQRQVLREMHASHCLLLFYGNPEYSRTAVAGKTYVYLRTGRPVLAVTGPGGVEERVEKAQAGWVVDPNDIGAIKRALSEVIDCYQTGKPLPSPRPDYVAQFRWDRLAGDVARVLDKVARHGG